MIPKFEELSWKNVSKQVHRVNSELATIIDQLDLNNQYTLYKISYPFGAMIFDTAMLNLPNSSNELVPLIHHTIPNNVKENLTYRSIPIGMSLSNNLEVHSSIENRIIPLTIMSEGTPFGVWESLDPSYSYFVKLAWNISSGARSIFMLPKIQEISGYQRIQNELGVTLNKPKRLQDQWQVFKTIAESEAFPTAWHTEVLFFSKAWFNKLTETKIDPAWSNLINYLYKTAWKQSMFWRFSSAFNLMWQQFATIVKSKSIRCGSYQLETLKHLVTMGVGALPCFGAEYNNSAGPLRELQKIFIDIYGLNYIPTIMSPHHFTVKPNTFGYYSLNEPTLIESVPKNREVSNVMQVTREIKQLFEQFKEEVIKSNLKIDNTPTYDLINKVSFDFIHTLYDPVSNLLASSKLPEQDHDLTFIEKNNKYLKFSGNSNFMRGCIRLSI